MSKKKETSSHFPLWVRILAIALAGLTASGILMYVIIFFANFF